MSPDDFKAWRQRMGYTQAQAAEALDVGKRIIGMYENGRRGEAEDRPVVIPRTVELACAALAAGITGYVPTRPPRD